MYYSKREISEFVERSAKISPKKKSDILCLLPSFVRPGGSVTSEDLETIMGQENAQAFKEAKAEADRKTPS